MITAEELDLIHDVSDTSENRLSVSGGSESFRAWLLFVLLYDTLHLH